MRRSQFTATSAIQFARLSGFSPIITTASKRNEDYLKSLGATHVIDRSIPLADAVKAVTSKPIKIIYDAISEKDTQTSAYEILSPGGTLILVSQLSIEETKLSKEKTIVLVFAFLEDPSQPIGVKLCKELPGLLESGALKVRLWFYV